jgi:hypothetical protein
VQFAARFADRDRPHDPIEPAERCCRDQQIGRSNPNPSDLI